MSKRLVWNFELCDDIALQLPETQFIENDDIRWEARFFWPSDVIITLHRLDDPHLELSHYKIKSRHDIYCLLSGTHYNLKIRRGQLLYKPLLKKTPYALGYGKKIKLDNQTPHPFLPGIDDINTKTFLAQIKQHGRAISVTKQALLYSFATTTPCTIELARLRIEDSIHFSINIESRSLSLVHAIAEQIIGKQPSSDYVTFLETR